MVGRWSCLLRIGCTVRAPPPCNFAAHAELRKQGFCYALGHPWDGAEVGRVLVGGGGGGQGGPWGAHVSTAMRIRVEVHEARWAIPLRFIYISSCGCVPPTQGLRHGAPAARGYRLAPSVPWHCADAALPIVSLSAMYFFEHHDAPWPSPRTCSRSAFSETYFCDDA